jgi:broad specificity phosphatase PhoE
LSLWKGHALKIALIRHGPTEWNAEGRIQGRTDIPLSAVGRTQMARLAPPAEFALARAYVSPLSRARETALLLGLRDPVEDARLTEHHWGRWEGLTRPEILAREGEDAFVKAGSGAAFTPPDGEPTGKLIARVRSFLSDAGDTDQDAVVVSHRGVLRTAYAIASGWQMLTPMPDELDLSAALVLSVNARGTIGIAALNVPLETK